ncbi:MAG TPA: TonB-dependent receptor [Puia sp.]|nr:TonB-dependent receptor [Puia sp.]
MQRIICMLCMLILFYSSKCQDTLIVRILDSESKEPLPSASILFAGTQLGSKADSNGIAVLSSIPNGIHHFSFRYVGYKEKTQSLSFPGINDTVLVLLEPDESELGEVVITSTRSNRSIRNIPTRVEFLAAEELEEKGNMRPGDIRMMLNESTGIQTQQISATSSNSSIRIQGLDGRYTQILKDGFPLYAGFSGGLSLLQTPPLDLKQVEIIKGSTSTLYGGGAIAGMVNLISKSPSTEQELKFLVNVISAGGVDLNSFYNKQFDKIGMTLFAGYSENNAYDPSNVGFSAIPRFNRFVFTPKIFFNINKTTLLSFGVNLAFENRTGGDMQYLNGHGDSLHSYFEENKSQRVSTQLNLNHRLSEKAGIVFRNSFSFFKRNINIPEYAFDGKQLSGYSEIDYNYQMKNAEWVFGLNVYTDDFKEYPTDSFPKRNYNQNTIGLFIQNTWTVNKWLQTEAGLRGDYVFDYGLALLPRVSALIKITSKFTSRIGMGLGYKTPTIFTEETERIQYQYVLPVSPDSNQLEKSYGVNWDFNYSGGFFEGLKFSFNQLFFFTRIRNPLVIDTLPGPIYKLVNSNGYLDSKGFETNIKFSYRLFQLYIGYTFTDAHLNENGIIRENPLTARNRLNNVLIYENEGKLKIGFEAYYYSSQPLSDGKTGKPFWTFGLMAEKSWNKFSLFINFENFTDARQTRFDTIYTGTITHPVFRDIYAPLDGFIVNGGFKMKL